MQDQSSIKSPEEAIEKEDEIMDNSESDEEDFSFLFKEFNSNTKDKMLKCRENIF